MILHRVSGVVVTVATVVDVVAAVPEPAVGLLSLELLLV